MSSMSRPAAASDPPVDMEKALKAAATEEEAEVAVVKPRLATCIRATMDVVVAAYTLFMIGVIVTVFKISNSWWDPWPGVLFCSAALLFTLWATPMVKVALVKRYTKHTPASDDSDVSTKLLE